MKMQYEVLDLSSKKQGTIDLNPAVFNVEVRTDILDRVIQWQLAKRRAGTHAVKNISAVQGTTKKPWKQKGTGRARQGSLRSVQFRKGAVAWGPVPRDHGYDLQKKVRNMGLRCALSSKVSEGKLLILKDFETSTPKSADLRKALEKLKVTSALFIDANAVNQNFGMALNNLMHMDAMPVMGANVYDIIRHDTLVLTTEAVKGLEARLI